MKHDNIYVDFRNTKGYSVFIGGNMKTNNVRSKLSHFKAVSTQNGIAYYSRREYPGADRIVEVIDQGGNAVCLPMFQEKDGTTRIAYHPDTIKSLIEFLEGK
jgi:hypothetical protein